MGGVTCPVGSRRFQNHPWIHVCLPVIPGIEDRIERLEEIAQTLEDGEIAFATAADLREKADDHHRAWGEDLDVGDGDIIEVDTDAKAEVPASGPESRRSLGQVNRSEKSAGDE